MISIAQYGLLILLLLFLLLHFSILIKIIPYNLVWGGRLKSEKAMVRFEILSIVINTLFIILILTQAGFLTIYIPNKIMTYALWFMTGLFLLNSVGNAISKNKFEQRFFTPITILMAIFSLIIALSNWFDNLIPGTLTGGRFGPQWLIQSVLFCLTTAIIIIM